MARPGPTTRQPILALDWSNANSSAKDGLDDDNTSTGAAAGSTITSGGWIVSGGLDRTVNVRPPSLYFIPLMQTGMV